MQNIFHDFYPFKKMEYLIGVNYSSVLATQQYLSKDRFTALFDFSGGNLPSRHTLKFILWNNHGTCSGLRSPSTSIFKSAGLIFYLFSIKMISIILQPRRLIKSNFHRTYFLSFSFLFGFIIKYYFVEIINFDIKKIVLIDSIKIYFHKVWSN